MSGANRILVPVLLVLGVCFSVAFPRSPAPVSADAPEDAFSAERAMALVEEIARRPHPVGSEDHDRVRGVVAAALRELGLPVEEEVSTLPDGRVLTNLVARRPGTTGAKAVALVSHYDSRETGPGAGDAAASVAAIVETMRALISAPPTARPVVALITDGEEQGLLGAKAFLAAHPEAGEEIGVVLNFEGRGSSGPSFMFETGQPNGDLVRLFAAAATHPSASSLTATIYRKMPNDTDFTVFLRAGFTGMNFAFIGGYTAYHTALDTPENLSRATLQHQGENMLSTARAFLDTESFEGTGDEVVYFDLLGRVLVHYSEGLAPVLALLGFALFGVTVWRRRPPGMVRGFLATGLAMILATALVYGLSRAVLALFPGRVYYPVRGTPEDPLWFGLFALAAALLALASLRFLGGGRPIEGPALGALGWWALLAAASAFVLPGASYLFLWPLVISTAALLRPGLPPIVLAVFALPGIVLVAPTIHALLVGMGLSRAFVGMPLTVLLAATTAPALLRASSTRRDAGPRES